MNLFVSAWDALYRAQTASLGESIVATVQGYGEARDAIISDVTSDEVFLDGPHGEAGGWNIQMRLSDLSGDPPKGTPVSCNGEASGKPLEVLEFKRNGGIGYITAVDSSTLTR